MKINFDLVLLELNRKPFKDGAGNDLALRVAASTALSVIYADEPGITGEEKFLRGTLARKIYDNQEVSLTVDELSLIKKMIGKYWAPLIVEQSWSEIDQK